MANIDVALEVVNEFNVVSAPIDSAGSSLMTHVYLISLLTLLSP